MKKPSLQTIIALIGLVVVTSGLGATAFLIKRNQDIRQQAAGDGVTVPACSLPTTASDIIVTFPKDSALYLDARVNRTNSLAAQSISGPFGATIPAGSYRVTLQSYDNHDDTIPPPDSIHYQIKEQWFALFKNDQGQVVTQTGIINDLPDKQQHKTQQVNDTLSINQTITSVEARHAFAPDSNPQSVYAVCAVLSSITQPSPEPTPEPTLEPTPPPPTATTAPNPSPTTPPPSPTQPGIGGPDPTPTQQPRPTATTAPSPTATQSPQPTVAPTLVPTATPIPSPTPSSAPGKACIGDFVILDINGNGIQDQEEVGLEGVQVQLFEAGQANPLRVVTTNYSGHYSFCDLSADNYQIRFLLPSNHSFGAAFQGGNPELDSNADPQTGISDTIGLNGVNNTAIDALLIPPAAIGGDTGQNQSSVTSTTPDLQPSSPELPRAGIATPTFVIATSGLLLLLLGIIIFAH